MKPFRSCAGCAALTLALLLAPSARAQWLTQSFQLQPGWNAVYLHVDASHIALDDLIPDANSPVAEIWLWKPSSSTMQFVGSPQNPVTPNSQWAQWTATRGDVDTLKRLVGNEAYLVKNSNASDYTWTVQGKPLPPNYLWTSSGLNLIGFPTPATTPPTLYVFLAPAPGLDLAKSPGNRSEIFQYVGGDLSANPSNVVALSARSVTVNRGKAFWVRAATNYYNRYYAPFELDLQSARGLAFGDGLGMNRLRVRNLTESSRVVTFTQVDSETPPSGQTPVVGAPRLLLRGAMNTTNLTYGYSLLHGSQVTLAPQGQSGSEAEVVVGLDRSQMTAPAGSLYAGVLRLTDGDGLSQVDLPVTAAVPSLAGLWVGDARVTQVGEYLKSYPKVSASAPAPRTRFLALDGQTGYAQLPSGTYFTPSGFTIEAWVRVHAVRNWSRLLDFGNGPANDSVVLPLSVGVTGVAAFQPYRVAQASDLFYGPFIGLETWVHLAVVQQASSDGTNALSSFFLNGEKLAEKLQLAPRAVTRTLCYLGKSEWPDALANADFDDVRIWSVPRSASDIRRDMFIDNYPAGTAGLVVQYAFSDPRNLGADSSGNGLDLTLVGGATQGVLGLSDADTAAANLDRQVSLAGRLPTGSELPGAVWTPTATEANRTYIDLAMSQDGSRILAAATGQGGTLLLSTNTGAAWSAFDPSAGATTSWRAVAVSASGQILVAAASPGGIWVSADGGTTWANRTPAGVNQTWSALVTASNGREIIAAGSPGLLYFSFDTGLNWSPVGVAKNWASIAASEDGTKLWAAAANDTLYSSGNGGVTWVPVGLALNWSSVTSSKDGLVVAASVNGGAIAVSNDGGLSWAIRDISRAWRRLACSSDGRQMAGVVDGGAIYVSPDRGASWFPQESNRAWQAVASSGDGTRLAAAAAGSTLFTRARTFAQYSFDRATGLIRSSDGAYISAGVNTNLTPVARPFALRLILHGDSTNVNLMQRVFVGPSAVSSNTIVASRESLLDAKQIGAARRLSAAHLPYSTNNLFWGTVGQFTPGSVLSFTVPLDYTDQTSNPFLHTFHPDHDNATADFQSVQPQGVESYGITRQIRLTLTPAGTDFKSLTASQLTRSGVYEETITLAGKAGATREYRTAGSFTLQRVSPVATLTTQ